MSELDRTVAHSGEKSSRWWLRGHLAHDASRCDHRHLSIVATDLLQPASGRLVDETDGCADNDPLNEVGDVLIKGQLQADVEVDVVVDGKHADGEKADECAQARPRHDAARSRVNFCIENGDNHDADEDGHHAVRHDFHYAFL